jgi:RNA polymerase sigma factor (sigma-70 family)
METRGGGGAVKTEGLSGGGVGPGFKAALGQLFTQLKKDAVRGMVPEPVFLGRVRGLGIDLTDEQLRGLRAELSRLGLRVEPKDVPANDDLAAARKVVGVGDFSGADIVRTLLERYRDERGRVSDLALEGVVRLAGLNEREAGVVWRAERGKARPAAVDVPPAAEPAREATGKPDTEPVAESASAPEAPVDPGGSGGNSVDVTAAVAAARARMEDDRFLTQPGQRILTAEEEVGLSVLLRGGPDRIAVEPKETELAKLPRTDIRRAAYECLTVHNQRLAHKIALVYGGHGLEHEDLFQHGMRGVLHAAVKFNPLSGNKFSTYATWWIRQSMTRAIADEGRLIRVPVHFHEVMRKVANVERARASQGLPTRDADLAVACDLPLSKVEEVRRISVRTDSLDRVLLDGATLGDLVASTRALPSVEAQVVSAIYSDEVMAVISRLSEREARVLVRRRGLDGDDPSTLEALGEEFGVTRERIRQVEGKALAKFRGLVREAGLVGDGRGEEEWSMLQTREWERRQKQAQAEARYKARKEVQLQLTLVRAEAERRLQAAEARVQAAEDRARAAEAARASPVGQAPTDDEALEQFDGQRDAIERRAETARAEVLSAQAEARARAAQAEAGRERGTAAAATRQLALAGARHRMHTALLKWEHRLRLAQAAAGRQEAVDAEVRVWEEAFLERMDRALARREQWLKEEHVGRLAQLKEARRETEAILLRRVQRAEAELAAAEAASADTLHARRQAAEARQQLRQHLEECGRRVAGLEHRLREAEAAFAQQHRYTRELEESLALRGAEAQQARQAEQQLTERLAQSEWAARAQIDQLRVQLETARAEAESRRPLRDRWRRD